MTNCFTLVYIILFGWKTGHYKDILQLFNHAVIIIEIPGSNVHVNNESNNNNNKIKIIRIKMMWQRQFF